MAVRLVVLLFERAFVELLQTEGAYEMLGMEFSEHGRDAAAGDRFVTTGAQRPAFRMIMSFAIGKTLVIEERSSVEWLSAILEK